LPVPNLDCQVISNLQRPILSESAANSAPRVWAAFGQPGGAREIIIVSNGGVGAQVGRLTGSLQLKGGGRFYAFRQDSVEAYVRGELLKFAFGVARIVQVSTNFTQQTDGVIVKSHENGLVFTWGGQPLFYSLSVGFQASANDLFFRLWGAGWIDDEVARCRYLSYVDPQDERLRRNPGPPPYSLPDAALLEPRLRQVVSDLNRLDLKTVRTNTPAVLPR